MDTPKNPHLNQAPPPPQKYLPIFLPKKIPESKLSDPKKSFDHPRHLKSGVPPPPLGGCSQKIASKGKFKHPYHLRPLCHSQAILVIFLFFLLILTLNYHTLHHHHQTTLINVVLLLIRSLFPSTSTHCYHHRAPSYAHLLNAHPNLIIFMLS